MRVDSSHLRIIKLFSLAILIEVIGFYYGPTSWLWLRSSISMNLSQALAYNAYMDTKLDNLFHFRNLAFENLLKPNQHARPIIIFSQLNDTLEYWCSPLDKTHTLSEGSVILGDKGLLGRIGEKRGTSYKIHPIEKKNLSIALLSEGLTNPLILNGNESHLIGQDMTRRYMKNMLLYTLPQDLNYPPNFPVARIKSVNENDNTNQIEAELLDNIASYNYAWVYQKIESSDGENL